MCRAVCCSVFGCGVFGLRLLSCGRRLANMGMRVSNRRSFWLKAQVAQTSSFTEVFFVDFLTLLYFAQVYFLAKFHCALEPSYFEKSLTFSVPVQAPQVHG